MTIIVCAMWLLVLCGAVGLLQGDHGLGADIVAILMLIGCIGLVVAALYIAIQSQTGDSEKATLKSSDKLEWPDEEPDENGDYSGDSIAQGVIDETKFDDHHAH